MRRSSRTSAAKASEAIVALHQEEEARRNRTRAGGGGGWAGEAAGAGSTHDEMEVMEELPSSSVRGTRASKRKATKAKAAASIAQSPLEDDGGGEGSKVDKGKGRAVEEFWDEDDGADDDFSEEERRVKKAKKPKLKKKIATWKELHWPSTVSLGSFPNEILDLIISVDSDFELRDYIALAGTCKFFRACFSDLVWQVLVNAAAPATVKDLSDVHVERAAESDYLAIGRKWIKRDVKDVSNYVANSGWRSRVKVGPWARSWRPARFIFTSGVEGAPGASRWGMSEKEWNKGEKAREAQRAAIREAVVADPNQRRTYDWSTGKMRLMTGVFDFEMMDALNAEELAELGNATLRMDYDFDPTPDHPEEETIYDPWPSLWRDLASELVNKPTLTKTEAKREFKISERELLALPIVPTSIYGPQKGGYRLSTLQALAYRSHGGPQGHLEHQKRLDERAAKAAETRHRNKMEKLEGEIVRLKTELMETGEELNKAFVFSEAPEDEPVSSPV